MEKQSITYSALDTQDVSGLLATLILTGSLEAGLRRLYERDPEAERELNVHSVLSLLYSKLPEPIATRILDKQNEIAGRALVQPWKLRPSISRTYTLLGGIKKIAGVVFIFWLFLFASAYLVWHQHPQKQGHVDTGISSAKN